jgi:hypothetical protein
MKLIKVLPLIVLCVACRKEANIKLPEIKPLPVMYCYISPGDTIIRLKLTLSKSIYSSGEANLFESLLNADVKLSGNQGSINLTYNNTTTYYEVKTSTYPIQFGQQYKLTVVTPNGDIATAETTVPNALVPITAATLETLTDANNIKSTNFKVIFQDQVNKKNYYRMYKVNGVVSPTNDTIYNGGNFSKMYSDNDKDGQQMEINNKSYDNGLTSAFYNLYLLNCNDNYYKFFTSIENYNDGNPFAEPSFVYTNVKGGFGVFAAYSQSKYFLKK